ncbi:MAG: helical backbone metal receptor [Burkholderiales bacterium]|jgi:iron complex transport system substrate-binding protein|nr:helical backbone metal receptor [Burkholderiales bacterium]
MTWRPGSLLITLLCAAVWPLHTQPAGAGAGVAAGLELRDDRGTLHRFAAPPQRIVSLLPSLSESVCALGACARLVAVDRYTNWPAELERVPRVGGLEDAQIEAIAALAPDVVLASSSARSLDRLDALGLRVVRLKSETHADVRRTLAVLAGLLGLAGQGEKTWAVIERDIERAAARVPPAWRNRRVYFEIGGGPWAAGSGSFIGETLSRLGLANVVPAGLGPFPKLNPEFVPLAQPDVVMGVQREAAAMAARPGWQALAALQRRRQCAFPTPQYEVLIRPGPRMGEAAGLLADCLAALPPPGAAP